MVELGGLRLLDTFTGLWKLWLVPVALSLEQNGMSGW
jgi:hypothetical protein